MADQYSLEAQPRTALRRKVKALRRTNMVPAVIYGVGGDPISVMCEYRPLEIVLKKAGGTHLVNVSVDGTVHNALIRDVQRDKVKRTILHVDFMRVDLTRTIRTEIPISFVGEPKLASGLQLTHNINSIEVESLPTDIPDHIVVDVLGLTELGAQITVADLPKIEGVVFHSDPHEIIVRVDTLAAAEEEPVTATSPVEPEVMEKGKKEEEDF